MDSPANTSPAGLEPPGIECPKCGCQHLPVLYTRQRSKRIMRIRVCRHCGRRVMTYEEVHGCVEVHRNR